MDSFLRQLDTTGEFDSSGEFTLDMARAVQKLSSFRVNDPAFPIWKFLQGACCAPAQVIRVGIGIETLLVDARSEHPFPDLEEICNQLPGEDPCLEAWRSAALSIADGPPNSADFKLSIRGQPGQHAVLGDGAYELYELEDDPSQASPYRMVMSQAWPPSRNLMQRWFAPHKRSQQIEESLWNRARFYPIPCYLSGAQIQSGNLEAALDPKVPEASIAAQTVAVSYRGTVPHNPQRFLSEPLVPGLASSLFTRTGEDTQIREEGLAGRLTVLFHTDESYPKTQLPVVHDSSSPARNLEVPLHGSECRTYSTRFVRKVTRGLALADYTVSGEPCLVDRAVFLGRDPEAFSKVGIVDRGIYLASWIVQLDTPGIHALCTAHGLQVDLSGSQIIKNQAWEALLQEVSEEGKRLMTLALDTLDPGSKAETSYRKFLAEQP